MQSLLKENNNKFDTLGSQGPVHNAKPSPTIIEDPNVVLYGMLFNDLNPVEFNEELDPPVKACFNCWGFDHHRKDCPDPETYNYCCNCGRQELSVIQCPRCVDAFYTLDSNKRNWIYKTFFKVDQYKMLIERDERKHNEFCISKHKILHKSEIQEDEHLDYDEYNCQDQDERIYDNTYLNRKRMLNLKDEDFFFETKQPSNNLETAYSKLSVSFNSTQGNRSMKLCEDDDEAKVAHLNITISTIFDSHHEESSESIEDMSEMVKTFAQSSGYPHEDFMCLLKAIKHLSVATQELVIKQVIEERKQIFNCQDECKSCDF